MKGGFTVLMVGLTLFNVGVALIVLAVAVLVVGAALMWTTVDDMQAQLTAHAESIQQLDEDMARVDAILRADED